jgi:hypothetical protein
MESAGIPVGNIPVTIGDRVVDVANEHHQCETVDLVGFTGKVREVYPYPIDAIIDCGVMVEAEDQTRLFPPPALPRLDVDDWAIDD